MINYLSALSGNESKLDYKKYCWKNRFLELFPEWKLQDKKKGLKKGIRIENMPKNVRLKKTIFIYSICGMRWCSKLFCCHLYRIVRLTCLWQNLPWVQISESVLKISCSNSKIKERKKGSKELNLNLSRVFFNVGRLLQQIVAWQHTNWTYQRKMSGENKGILSHIATSFYMLTSFMWRGNGVIYDGV